MRVHQRGVRRRDADGVLDGRIGQVRQRRRDAQREGHAAGRAVQLRWPQHDSSGRSRRLRRGGRGGRRQHRRELRLGAPRPLVQRSRALRACGSHRRQPRGVHARHQQRRGGQVGDGVQPQSQLARQQAHRVGLLPRGDHSALVQRGAHELAVGADAAAGPASRLDDKHVVPEAQELAGGRQARHARAHNDDPPAAVGRRGRLCRGGAAAAAGHTAAPCRRRVELLGAAGGGERRQGGRRGHHGADVDLPAPGQVVEHGRGELVVAHGEAREALCQREGPALRQAARRQHPAAGGGQRDEALRRIPAPRGVARRRRLQGERPAGGGRLLLQEELARRAMVARVARVLRLHPLEQHVVAHVQVALHARGAAAHPRLLLPRGRGVGQPRRERVVLGQPAQLRRAHDGARPPWHCRRHVGVHIDGERVLRHAGHSRRAAAPAAAAAGCAAASRAVGAAALLVGRGQPGEPRHRQPAVGLGARRDDVEGVGTAQDVPPAGLGVDGVHVRRAGVGGERRLLVVGHVRGRQLARDGARGLRARIVQCKQHARVALVHRRAEPQDVGRQRQALQIHLVGRRGVGRRQCGSSRPCRRHRRCRDGYDAAREDGRRRRRRRPAAALGLNEGRRAVGLARALGDRSGGGRRRRRRRRRRRGRSVCSATDARRSTPVGLSGDLARPLVACALHHPLACCCCGCRCCCCCCRVRRGVMRRTRGCARCRGAARVVAAAAKGGRGARSSSGSGSRRHPTAAAPPPLERVEEARVGQPRQRVAQQPADHLARHSRGGGGAHRGGSRAAAAAAAAAAAVLVHQAGRAPAVVAVVAQAAGRDAAHGQRRARAARRVLQRQHARGRRLVLQPHHALQRRVAQRVLGRGAAVAAQAQQLAQALPQRLLLHAAVAAQPQGALVQRVQVQRRAVQDGLALQHAREAPLDGGLERQAGLEAAQRAVRRQRRAAAAASVHLGGGCTTHEQTICVCRSPPASIMWGLHHTVHRDACLCDQYNYPL